MKQIMMDVADAASHLALDEAMLLAADAGQVASETIRLWQFDHHVVVLGRSSKVDAEVNRDFCDRERVPVMRRCSGGAAVVGGPGCLMYSVILSQREKPELQKVDAAHRFVMDRVVAAIRCQVPEVQHQGICDVTFQNRKCSGNSLRITREHLLYHGTILYDADLAVLANCLSEAPRQPEYRRRRDHHDFVTNIPVRVNQLKEDLLNAFGADGDLKTGLPVQQVAKLKTTKYANPAWNLRH
tara:strand:+ start:130527 stop:131249 length:723 start_codon:yes stop_codon:yes gene_type:complete